MNTSREALVENMRADLWFTAQQASWHPRMRFSSRALYYQRTLRRAEYWESQHSVMGRLAFTGYKFRLLSLGEKTGLSIPRGTCGPGLSIAHPGLLVVNGGARLGARCRLSQGVTVGGSQAGAPKIGDDVFLGPNAQVIGAVTVGDGATILPGAVVTMNVAARATVGGVPARVLREDTEPWHVAIAPTAALPPVSSRPAPAWWRF